MEVEFFLEASEVERLSKGIVEQDFGDEYESACGVQSRGVNEAMGEVYDT